MPVHALGRGSGPNKAVEPTPSSCPLRSRVRARLTASVTLKTILCRRRGQYCEMHVRAQTRHPPCEPINDVLPLLCIEVVGAQGTRRLVTREPMEHAPDDRMRSRHHSPFLAPTCGKGISQRRQSGPLRTGRGMGALASTPSARARCLDGLCPSVVGLHARQQFPVYPKDPIQPMSEDSFGAISCPMYRV